MSITRTGQLAEPDLPLRVPLEQPALPTERVLRCCDGARVKVLVGMVLGGGLVGMYGCSLFDMDGMEVGMLVYTSPATPE